MIYDIYYISASTKKKKKNQIYGDLRVPKNYKKKKKFLVRRIITLSLDT